MRRPIIAITLILAATPAPAAQPPTKTAAEPPTKTAAVPAKPAAAPVKEARDRTRPRASAAWVRRNPAPGRPSAGYFVLAGGDQPDRLVSVTAPGTRIEMHSMTMAGGIMKMARLDGLAVPAGSTVNFASGGNHLMIFGLPATATALPITLVFASGAKATTTAAIRDAADDHAGH